MEELKFDDDIIEYCHLISKIKKSRKYLLEEKRLHDAGTPNRKGINNCTDFKTLYECDIKDMELMQKRFLKLHKKINQKSEI